MTNTVTTDLFLALTPEHVLDAVEQAGHRCNPVCYPLNSYENRVYEIELEDRTRLIAKFYRPGRWNEAQIMEEHAFMKEIEAAELPVCPVLPLNDAGETLACNQDGIFYCLYPRRGGRAPDELTEDLAERLGMLVGRMHAIGATSEAEHRVTLDPDTYLLANLAYLEERELLPRSVRGRYGDAVRAIHEGGGDKVKSLKHIRLHGDLHHGNLLLRDGVFNILDFDDMVMGPAVQDVWLLFPGRDDWTSRLRYAFLDGYEQFRSFEHKELNAVETLRAMRLVHYATWLARRWHDPVFPRTWPHFGTEDYWREQTEALEEIRGLLDVGPGARSQHAPTEELTNADYFYDWEDN